MQSDNYLSTPMEEEIIENLILREDTDNKSD